MTYTPTPLDVSLAQDIVSGAATDTLNLMFGGLEAGWLVFLAVVIGMLFVWRFLRRNVA